MRELPEDVEVYKKTPIFNQLTVPAGLLKTHTTKAGTWGRIRVNKGKLLYIIESSPQQEIELNVSKYGVVEPQVPHYIKPLGEVEFFVEFLK